MFLALCGEADVGTFEARLSGDAGKPGLQMGKGAEVEAGLRRAEKVSRAGDVRDGQGVSHQGFAKAGDLPPPSGAEAAVEGGHHPPGRNAGQIRRFDALPANGNTCSP